MDYAIALISTLAIIPNAIRPIPYPESFKLCLCPHNLFPSNPFLYNLLWQALVNKVMNHQVP